MGEKRKVNLLKDNYKPFSSQVSHPECLNTMTKLLPVFRKKNLSLTKPDKFVKWKNV